VDLAGKSERGFDAAHLTVKEIAPGITGRTLAEGFEVPECHLFLSPLLLLVKMGLVGLNSVEGNRRPSCEDVGTSEGRRGRDEERTGFAVNERRSRSGRKRVSETMHSQTADDDAVRETKEEGSEARREAERASTQASESEKPSRRGKKANTTASASQSNQTFIHKREVGEGAD
jgi:hypothetical protein